MTELGEPVDRVFADVAERAHIPGIAYGVIHRGELVHTGGVGTLHAGRDERPDADSVFRIASMTKSFTAATILSLRDEGVLRLDERVAAYAPELADWRGPTADSPELTLRHLMTMSGGLPEDDAWADRHLADDPATMDALFAAGGSFAHAPGTAFEYANLGWAMLGRVVEHATGSRVQDLVRERLLGPLGMTCTGWTVDELPAGVRIATGWRWLDDEGFVAEPEPLGDGGLAPMGGLWSTVRDIARWVAFQLDAHPARADPDDGPVSRATRREQQTTARSDELRTVTPRPGGPDRVIANGYAMGLFVRMDQRIGTHVGHSGGLPGFGSHMRWIPDRDFGLVALGNARYAPMGDAIVEVFEVLEDLGTLPAKREVPVTPVLAEAFARLTRLLDDWDEAEADALFADNVFQDDDRERRRRQAERMRAQHGPLVPAGPVTATSRLGGRCDLAGGHVRLTVQLSAYALPLIQGYELEPVPTETAEPDDV